MGDIRYMYNPCKKCGSNDLEIGAVKGDKTLADGTLCASCRKCNRYGSAANWNKVNPSAVIEEE